MHHPSPRGLGTTLWGLACLALCSACQAGLRPSLIPGPAAVSALEQELAQNPSDLELALRLGLGYRAAGRLPEARGVLEQLHDVAPSDGAVALFLGLTLEDLLEFSRARVVYESHLVRGIDGPHSDEIRDRIDVVKREELRLTVAAALRDESRLADRAPDPTRVAVFPFGARGGHDQLAPLGWAFAAMLITDLSQTDRISVLDRTEINVLLQELALVRSGRVDPTTAALQGRLLGAGNVVQGLVGGGGGGGSGLRVDAAVVDVLAGLDGQRSLSHEGLPSELFELEKRVAFSIYESLGIELTLAERERVNKRWTDNIDALLAFGHGLEAEALGDFDGAARHFETAVLLDPGFSPAGEAARELNETAAAAGSRGTAAASERATARLLAGSGYEEFFDLAEMLEGVGGLVPTEEDRDPLADIGGLGPGGPGVKITIPRPGGSS